jgi:hypothetical protein
MIEISLNKFQAKKTDGKILLQSQWNHPRHWEGSEWKDLFMETKNQMVTSLFNTQGFKGLGHFSYFHYLPYNLFGQFSTLRTSRMHTPPSWLIKIFASQKGEDQEHSPWQPQDQS